MTPAAPVWRWLPETGESPEGPGPASFLYAAGGIKRSPLTQVEGKDQF